jgi:tetratricopeptide (TPR) repeat protein
MRNHPNRPTPITDPALPWDLTDPVRGELRLSNLMQELLREPQQRARAIEVGTQVARAQSLQGKLPEAERTLEHAERMLPSVSELAPRLRALLERGRLLVLRKTPVEAGSRFLEAWLLGSTSSEIFFAIDAAQMMSVIDTPKKQAQWTARGLELAESSTDSRARVWCGHLHYELGAHLEDVLQLTRALESYERAASAFRGEQDARGECIARSAAARVLRLTNRLEEALAMQHEVRLELQKVGRVEGVVFEEIAECLHTLKRNEESEEYFRRAHALLSTDEWMVNNQPARIKRLKTLGTGKQS